MEYITDSLILMFLLAIVSLLKFSSQEQQHSEEPPCCYCTSRNHTMPSSRSQSWSHINKFSTEHRICTQRIHHLNPSFALTWGLNGVYIHNAGHPSKINSPAALHTRQFVPRDNPPDEGMMKPCEVCCWYS